MATNIRTPPSQAPISKVTPTRQKLRLIDENVKRNEAGAAKLGLRGAVKSNNDREVKTYTTCLKCEATLKEPIGAQR